MNIKFVKPDDWTCMLIDGLIVAEGHSLSDTDVLTALGISYETEYIEYEEDDGDAWWEFRNSIKWRGI